MDAIEALTPGDALFMVQGSTATGAEAEGGMRNVNGFNLSTGAAHACKDNATASARFLCEPSRLKHCLSHDPSTTKHCQTAPSTLLCRVSTRPQATDL
jgi:hypothetical protein